MTTNECYCCSIYAGCVNVQLFANILYNFPITQRDSLSPYILSMRTDLLLETPPNIIQIQQHHKLHPLKMCMKLNQHIFKTNKNVHYNLQEGGIYCIRLCKNLFQLSEANKRVLACTFPLTIIIIVHSTQTCVQSYTVSEIFKKSTEWFHGNNLYLQICSI